MSATTEVRLAKAVLTSHWFHRTESHNGDYSWCTFCGARGGYHDYSLVWHKRTCVIRVACRVLRTKEPMGLYR